MSEIQVLDRSGLVLPPELVLSLQKTVCKVYSKFNPGFQLDNGQHGGMPGSMTSGSAFKYLTMLFTEVNTVMPLEECRIMEIGHGIGALSTIVAEALPVQCVIGAEINWSRFKWSVQLGYETLGDRDSTAAPVAFLLKDASTLKTLRGIHVLFAFDVGMSPVVLRRIAFLQQLSGTVRFTFTFFDKDEMSSFGFKDFELCGSIKVNMLGGHGSFTGYLYKFVKPVAPMISVDSDADLEGAFLACKSKISSLDRLRRQILELAAADVTEKSSRHANARKRSSESDTVDETPVGKQLRMSPI